MGAARRGESPANVMWSGRCEEAEPNSWIPQVRSSRNGLARCVSQRHDWANAMKKPRWFFPLLAAVSVLVSAPAIAQSTAVDRIPVTLKPWESWATWSDDALRQSPASYADAKTPLTFWPSELRLFAAASGATFRQTVSVYSPSWVALPGGELLWPSGVTAGGKPVAVLGRDGRPVVRLPAGTQEISGTLEWKVMPQNIALPPETGIVLLEVEGQRVDAPLWDEEGRLWLKRGASPEEAAGPDFLSINLYAALEDGINSKKPIPQMNGKLY